MSATVPISVWNNVKEYFKEHLDDRYDLQDVIRYKDPMDSYLYMVIAKHKNYSAIKASIVVDHGLYGLLGMNLHNSLNGGHYDIKTYEDALSICEARRK